MNDWDISLGEWRDSNPHGLKVHNFIMTYPEWSIYLRRDNRFQCPDHYDQATDTPKSFGNVDCWCWGLGVAISGYIVPCKVSRGRTAEVAPIDGQVRDIAGYVDLNQDVIHFPRGIIPRDNDIVLQCEWNTPPQKISLNPSARPIRIHTVYIIRLTNAHFQRELSHISCGAETLGINSSLMNELLITKLGNLPVFDGTDTWKDKTNFWNV